MVYLITFIAVFAAIWAMVVYLDKIKYATDVRSMRMNSESNTLQFFRPEMLQGLPAPVQRYLRRVIPDGFPFSTLVRLTHEGRFKSAPDKDWMDIHGEQYFNTTTPAFIWRAKTKLFTADDRYFANRGVLKVKLFSILPVVLATGKYIDEGELQRWMGEHFWFPTNLLNQNLLHWDAIDDHSSRLTLRYEGFEIPMVYHFGEEGLLEKVTCKRYADKKNKLDWSGRVSDYQDYNGLYVPTHVQAAWDKPEGPYTYADFIVTSIEHIPDPVTETRRPPAKESAHKLIHSH